MNQKVLDIIKYDSESPCIDFKMEQYPIHKHAKKHEMLKDISAMANHPSNEDKFIIIGVKEKNGIASEFFKITKLIDQSKYQQYLDSNIEPKINFEYRSFNFEQYQLSYFRIYNNTDRPYLFKKPVQNSLENNKIEFREGDGFIRTGTSTKKLMRTDFDNIYTTKHKEADRKSDIEIRPHLGLSETKEFEELQLKYFDIDIVNHSNHSIDLDVEMIIYFDDTRTLISETTLLKEFDKNKPKKNNEFGVVIPDLSGIRGPNFHIDTIEKEESVFIERLKLRNEKFAINIPQMATEKNIFLQELLLIEDDSFIIQGELIIRSDDFTEGILKKKIEFKVVK